MIGVTTPSIPGYTTRHRQDAPFDIHVQFPDAALNQVSIDISRQRLQLQCLPLYRLELLLPDGFSEDPNDVDVHWHAGGTMTILVPVARCSRAHAGSTPAVQARTSREDSCCGPAVQSDDAEVPSADTAGTATVEQACSDSEWDDANSVVWLEAGESGSVEYKSGDASVLEQEGFDDAAESAAAASARAAYAAQTADAARAQVCLRAHALWAVHISSVAALSLRVGKPVL